MIMYFICFYYLSFFLALQIEGISEKRDETLPQEVESESNNGAEVETQSDNEATKEESESNENAAAIDTRIDPVWEPSSHNVPALVFVLVLVGSVVLVGLCFLRCVGKVQERDNQTRRWPFFARNFNV